MSAARTRSRIALGALVGLAHAGAGCAVESPKVNASAYPSAGLYTPGSTLGASDPTDIPTPGMGLGDRCVPFATAMAGDGGGATEGKLTVTYQSKSLGGRYAPKNCTAVWIESPDGRYVATIEVGALLRKPGLVYWQDHACVEKTGPDVVTSATLSDHMKTHMLIWKGLDLEGNLVPDGPYKLQIEVTESDKEPGELQTFDFTKGPAPFGGDVPVSFEGALESASITWEPGGST